MVEGVSIRQFSQKTTSEIGEMLGEFRRRVRGTTGLSAPPDLRSNAAPVRLAKTGTGDTYPTYTVPGGDLLPVIFGEYRWTTAEWTPSAANYGDPEWLPYEPEYADIVWSRHGWIPEDQIVECVWLHGRWQVAGEQWAIRKAVLNSNATAGSYGTADVYHAGTVTDYEIDVYNNWMNGGSDVSSGKEVIVRHFLDEDKWVIIEAEC